MLEQELQRPVEKCFQQNWAGLGVLRLEVAGKVGVERQEIEELQVLELRMLVLGLESQVEAWLAVEAQLQVQAKWAMG